MLKTTTATEANRRFSELLRLIESGDTFIVTSHGRPRIRHWASRYETAGASVNVTLQSLRLAVLHHITIWDAPVLTTAAQANCRLLLSEDMHHGFTWSGVTVMNPFASPRHPVLTELLNNLTP